MILPSFIICVLIYVNPKFERDPSSTYQVIANYISVAVAVAFSVYSGERYGLWISGFDFLCLPK